MRWNKNRCEWDFPTVPDTPTEERKWCMAAEPPQAYVNWNQGMRSPGRKGIYAGHMWLLLALFCVGMTGIRKALILSSEYLRVCWWIQLPGGPFRNSISRRPLPAEPLPTGFERGIYSHRWRLLKSWSPAGAWGEFIGEKGPDVWRDGENRMGFLRAQGKHLVITIYTDWSKCYWSKKVWRASQIVIWIEALGCR